MTSGIGAYGLYATGVGGEGGTPSTIMATGVAVTTGADPGPGTSAVGVLASAGGQGDAHQRIGDDIREWRL